MSSNRRRRCILPTAENWLRASPASGLLRSFDGGVEASATTYRPERYAAFAEPVPEAGPIIARGAGLSYAAASFRQGGSTIDMQCFDRILAFDGENGTVEAEAGITMASLQEFLSKGGWYLPVQPGHGRITLGGCIGADVHGKNPAVDGNFSSSVVGMRLFNPDVGTREITAASAPELFAATCGGYGLTGIIVSARLTTRRLPCATLLVKAVPVADPIEGGKTLRAEAPENDIVYSWHDFTVAEGPGLVFVGRFDREAAGASSAPSRPIARSPRLGGAFPIRLHARWTTRVLNAVYHRLNRPAADLRRLELRRALFPIEGREAYFRLFGVKGFHEYQALVPDETYPDYVREVRALGKRHDIAITLASGKAFAGDSRLLQFGGKGICFAINLPRTNRSPAMLGDLDRLLVAVGGRPNIIKDSRLPQAVVAACYPEYERFRTLLRAADPARRFRSELSERLGL